MRWWKVLGLAGVAGVAATGAVVARAERQRRAYTPDEVRAKLHDRLAAVDPGGPTETGAALSRPSDDQSSGDNSANHRFRRVRRSLAVVVERVRR